MGSIDRKVPTVDPELLMEQLDLLNANPQAFSGSQTVRQSLLEKAKRSIGSLEQPFETMQRLSYGVSPNDSCLGAAQSD